MFAGSQRLYTDFQLRGGMGALNPLVAQGLTVFCEIMLCYVTCLDENGKK